MLCRLSAFGVYGSGLRDWGLGFGFRVFVWGIGSKGIVAGRGDFQGLGFGYFLGFKVRGITLQEVNKALGFLALRC